VGALKAGYTLDPEVCTRSLDSLYEKALGVAVQRALEIAPRLVEWERLNWDRNFALLEQIDAGVRESGDLLRRIAEEQPREQARTFEEAYRNAV
jgi:hypothetical protein